jgi:hypothetical protein
MGLGDINFYLYSQAIIMVAKVFEKGSEVIFKPNKY